MKIPQFIRFKEPPVPMHVAGTNEEVRVQDDIVFNLAALVYARRTEDGGVYLNAEKHSAAVADEDAERVWQAIKSQSEIRPEV